MTKNPNQNLIFSPFSIQLCLGLTHLGARGDTADEIAQVIGYSSSFNVNHLTDALERLNEHSVIQIANKIYVKFGYDLKPNYEVSVREKLKSQVESIDFRQTVLAAKKINDWIETQTNHRLKDVVKPQQLDDAIRMVLINAVYFKANWFRKFYTAEPDNFTNQDQSVTKVQMMTNEDHFSVGRVDAVSAYVVKLNYYQNYNDTKTAMFIVIPDDVDGLTKIEQNLDKLNFREIKERMESKYIHLTMPKFTFETEVSLVDILKNSGMRKAFTEAADFSDMLSSNEKISISDAIHKAFIKVDEKGTEAAAVTGSLELNSLENIGLMDKVQLNFNRT